MTQKCYNYSNICSYDFPMVFLWFLWFHAFMLGNQRLRAMGILPRLANLGVLTEDFFEALLLDTTAWRYHLIHALALPWLWILDWRFGLVTNYSWWFLRGAQEIDLLPDFYNILWGFVVNYWPKLVKQYLAATILFSVNENYFWWIDGIFG